MLSVYFFTEMKEILKKLSRMAKSSEGKDNAFNGFMESLFQEIQPSFNDFPQKVKKVLCDLITHAVRRNIQNKERLPTNVLKCYLALLESNETESGMDVNFFVPLLKRERYPPTLLPCVSRTLNRVVVNGNLTTTVPITEEDAEQISDVFLKYSAPENDENFRYAVAQSLTAFKDFLKILETNNGFMANESREKVLCRLVL